MITLRQALSELQQLEKQIRNSGPVAPDGLTIDTYSPGGRDVAYARLKADKPIFEGKTGKLAKTKTSILGQAGSIEHRNYEARVTRRNALKEIERLLIALQRMIDSPIWESAPTIPPEMRVEKDGERYSLLVDGEGQRWALTKATGALKSWAVLKPGLLVIAL